jgi:hypothetical protein
MPAYAVWVLFFLGVLLLGAKPRIGLPDIPPLTCTRIGLMTDKPAGPLFVAYFCTENKPLDPILSRSRRSNILHVDQYRWGPELR